jgi:hypothetical protein
MHTCTGQIRRLADGTSNNATTHMAQSHATIPRSQSQVYAELAWALGEHWTDHFVVAILSQLLFETRSAG